MNEQLVKAWEEFERARLAVHQRLQREQRPLPSYQRDRTMPATILRQAG